MRTYIVYCVDNVTFSERVRGRDRRDALVNFARPRGFHVTQNTHGRRYYAVDPATGTRYGAHAA
jgi:hypothetical protein